MPAVRNCEGVVLPSGVRSLHGRMVMAMLLSRCTDNARILLVIQFPRDTATVTALHAQGLWAFNDSLCEALF
jgi:hypothetical protein